MTYASVYPTGTGAKGCLNLRAAFWYSGTMDQVDRGEEQKG